ncbi:hypothetical protein GCM10009809_06000 [Isoptericola hypogeus]|uniref:ABC3 transporter permease C-terminal domain-containing protein n=1 Tax=Isoptericola hypogeus TaxID=300179 RepID=A0ABP4UV99_9MICO
MFGLLLRRHLRTAWGATLVLALVTLLTAAVATSAARAISDMRAKQVDHATAHLSPLVRDAVSRAATTPGAGEDLALSALGIGGSEQDTPAVPGEPDWAGFLDGMTALRDAQPEPLRSVLGEPDFVVDTEPFPVEIVPSGVVEESELVVRAAPRLREAMRLVDGAWPRATRVAVGPSGASSDEPVEIVLTPATSDTLAWRLGGTYRSESIAFPSLTVVGIVEPVDPGASRWHHQPFGLVPQVIADPERGDLGTSAVYTDPAMIAPLTTREGAQTVLWYPVSTASTGAGDVEALAAQVRGFTHASHEVVAGDDLRLRLRTQLADVLDDVLGERAGTDAILAVLVVGPLGAVGAVAVLAARLVVDRRRAALAVLLARGMTGLQVRGLMAAEGLAVSVPGAVAGLAVGLAVWPGGVTGLQVLLTAAAALAPALAAAAVTVPRGLRRERSDLTAPHAGRSRWRTTVDLAVVGLAALATALLLRRGVVAGGVDPLLAATPLLVSVAATLLAVRATPFAARAAERVLARRRDLVPFLGAARATRAPAGGVVPALALVLSVGVATSSAVLLSTLDAGVERQASVELGADLRVTGPVVTPEALAALGEADGVAEVATVARLDDPGWVLGADDVAGSGQQVAVLAADAAALERVQAGVPDAPAGLGRLVDGPDVGAGGAVGAAVHDVEDVAAGAPGAAMDLVDERVELDVVARIGPIPGLGTDEPFVLVDAASAAGPLDVVPEPRTALVALADDVDPAAAARAVRAVVAQTLPGATVDDPATVTADVLASPASSGIAAGAAVAVAVAAVLSVTTVVLMLVLAAPDRERLLAVLRSMGLRRRETRGIVAWEVAPWAVVAIVVGAVLGVVVPALLLASVDLRPLTGGDVQPALTVDLVPLLAAAAGFGVVVALGVVVASALGRRAATADRLRAAAD